MQQIGRLSECGHKAFKSSAPSPASPSSLFRPALRNCGSEIGSATELEPVLDTMETGLEFRDEAIELGSEGKHARDL